MPAIPAITSTRKILKGKSENARPTVRKTRSPLFVPISTGLYQPRLTTARTSSARYKAQLKKYGVKVLSATDNISEGPEGIIPESLLEGMAEYYSAELAEKVIRGHTENALKCKYNGGTPTFGYIINSEKYYQIDSRTAPVVLEMFTRYVPFGREGDRAHLQRPLLPQLHHGDGLLVADLGEGIFQRRAAVTNPLPAHILGAVGIFQGYRRHITVIDRCNIHSPLLHEAGGEGEALWGVVVAADE